MKNSILDEIIEKIFQLDNPKINISRKDQILDFISASINGDKVESYLVISVNLEKTKEIVFVCILTNARFIQIKVDKEKEIDSSSVLLDGIIAVNRKSINEDRAKIEIVIQTGSFFIEYDVKNHHIAEFFQKLDNLRAKGHFNG
jgi:hypothetical protein